MVSFTEIWTVPRTALPLLSDPDLTTEALRVLRVIVCLISALAYHERTEEVPHEVQIALPRDTKIPVLDHPPIGRTSRRRGTDHPRRIETLGVEFTAQPQKPSQWTAILRKVQVDDCPGTLSELQAGLAEFLAPLLERLEETGQASDTRTMLQPGLGWIQE